MVKRLIGIFVTPQFAEEEKQNEASLLNHLLLNLFAILVLGTIATILGVSQKINALFVIGIFFLAFLITWLIMRSGRVRLATLALIVESWSLTTLSLYFSGGMNSLAPIAYLAVVIMTGMLLGKRAAWIVTSTILLAGLGFVYLNVLNRLPSPFFLISPPNNYIIFALVLILNVTTVNLALQNLEQGLQRLRKEINERKLAEEREHAMVDQLRHIIEMADELISCPDLDTLYRRAVEMARSKLGVERSSIYVLSNDGETFLGTYGTDDLGQTTDEHGASWTIQEYYSTIIRDEKYYSYAEIEQGYFVKGKLIDLGYRGWEAHTLIRAGEKLIGVFHNDSAISKSPPNEGVQSALAVYCSLLGNIIDRKRSEEALRESEQRLQTIYNSINEGVFVHDSNTGQILDVNRVACEMYGYTREEILNLTVGDISSGEPPYTHEDALRWMHAAALGSPQLFEWRGKDKQGRLLWVEVNIRRTEIEGEERFLATVRNITERRQAELLRIAFYRISEAAQAAQNLDELYKLVHTVIADLMPANNFYIALYDETNNLYTIPYFVDEVDKVSPPDKLGHGMTAFVIRTGKPILVTPEVFHQLSSNGEVDLVGKPSIDWLGVPLKTTHGTIGAMAVQTYKETDRLSKEDEDILVFISSQVAMAIERKRAEEREHTMIRGLHAIVAAADELIGCPDLDTLYRRAVELSREKLGAERSGLYVMDEARDIFSGTYGTDMQGHTTDEHGAQWRGVFFSDITRQGNLYTLDTDKEIAYWEDGERHVVGKGWAAFTVLRVGEKAVGIFSNDQAISRTPPNEVKQEILSLYCSLLGNIIERKRIEEALKTSELHLKKAQSMAQVGSWEMDLKTEKVYASDEAIAVYNVDKDRHRDSNSWLIQDILKPTEYGKLEAVIENLAERGNPLDEEIKLDVNGGPRYIHSRVELIRDNNDKPVKISGTLQDITAEKQAEIDRERLIKELEAKNAELERFTYTVSHDLKSPLITIRGFLGFLEKDALDGKVSQMENDIERISLATTKMQRLLDDLLQLSRVGRLINPPEDTPFADIVHSALELVAGQVARRGVQVQVMEDLPVVHGDRERLVEVVQNLVDNAVKFMGNQAEPRVEIGCQINPEKQETIFYVRDNGVGIDPRHHERIFGLFNKLDTESEGSGVGLALVRRIIEVHHGRIWIESDGQENGATFYFTLPAQETSPSSGA